MSRGRMTTHSDHKYSITVHTDDFPILGCLRALAKYSQRTGNNQIPWGGTKDKEWEKQQHHLTFHFFSPEYRDIFVSEATRLLPPGLWKEVARSNNDPAVSPN
jgi:hypothetical protein